MLSHLKYFKAQSIRFFAVFFSKTTHGAYLKDKDNFDEYSAWILV